MYNPLENVAGEFVLTSLAAACMSYSSYSMILEMQMTVQLLVCWMLLSGFVKNNRKNFCIVDNWLFLDTFH